MISISIITLFLLLVLSSCLIDSVDSSTVHSFNSEYINPLNGNRFSLKYTATTDKLIHSIDSIDSIHSIQFHCEYYREQEQNEFKQNIENNDNNDDIDPTDSTHTMIIELSASSISAHQLIISSGWRVGNIMTGFRESNTPLECELKHNNDESEYITIHHTITGIRMIEPSIIILSLQTAQYTDVYHEGEAEFNSDNIEDFSYQKHFIRDQMKQMAQTIENPYNRFSLMADDKKGKPKIPDPVTEDSHRF